MNENSTTQTILRRVAGLQQRSLWLQCMLQIRNLPEIDASLTADEADAMARDLETIRNLPEVGR